MVSGFFSKMSASNVLLRCLKCKSEKWAEAVPSTTWRTGHVTAAVLYSFQLIKLDFTFSKYVLSSCSFDEMSSCKEELGLGYVNISDDDKWPFSLSIFISDNRWDYQSWGWVAAAPSPLSLTGRRTRWGLTPPSWRTCRGCSAVWASRW